VNKKKEIPIVPWQVKLFEKSLMKKEKVRLILKTTDFSHKKVFDLGCSNGTVSYFLKKTGGKWIHADLDFENLITSKKILLNNLFLFPEDTIPLKGDQFDLVLALDILEHIEDESIILKEIKRILRNNGKVIISTPISGKYFILNSIKSMFGLTPEIYGHKREGYSLIKLKEILRMNGFQVLRSSTYAKFFVELFEIILNILFVKINKKKKSKLRSGEISPSSEADINKNLLLFKIYSIFIYPIVCLITKIDKLLFFKTGYATFIVAKKKTNQSSTWE